MREIKGRWTDLFNGFRMGLDSKKMLLAFVGLAASLFITFLVVFLVTLGASEDVRGYVKSGWVTQAIREIPKHYVDQVKDLRQEAREIAKALEEDPDHIELPGRIKSHRSVVCSFVAMCIGTDALIFVLLWAVWSYFGSAICRMAAFEIAKDERMEMGAALGFARQKWHAVFWAPIAVAIFIAFFALCNVVGGLFGRYFFPMVGVGIGLLVLLYLLIVLKEKLGNWLVTVLVSVIVVGVIEFVWYLLGKAIGPGPEQIGEPLGYIPWLGELTVSIFFPFALLSALLIVLLTIGLVLGLLLMCTAVSTEGTDSFDAISRSFSYIYARPWQYAWYHLVALVYGVVCVGFFSFITYLTFRVALFTGQLGMGESFAQIRAYMMGADSAEMLTSAKLAGFILFALVLVCAGVAISYAISYIFSAKTIIYFLLRQSVDGTEMTEIYDEEDEEDGALPEPDEPAASEEPEAPEAAEPADESGEQPEEEADESKDEG